MNTDWEQRVQQLEEEGLTRSDAQAVVDAEDQRNVHPLFDELLRDFQRNLVTMSKKMQDLGK